MSSPAATARGSSGSQHRSRAPTAQRATDENDVASPRRPPSLRGQPRPASGAADRFRARLARTATSASPTTNASSTRGRSTAPDSSDRAEESRRCRPDARRSGSRKPRPDEHHPQTASTRMGRAARKARRPLRLPAKHPPAHREHPTQQAPASDRPLPPLRVTDPARREGAASAPLAGAIGCRCTRRGGIGPPPSTQGL